MTLCNMQYDCHRRLCHSYAAKDELKEGGAQASTAGGIFATSASFPRLSPSLVIAHCEGTVNGVNYLKINKPVE